MLHEFLTCDLPHAWQTLPGPVIHVAHDGAQERTLKHTCTISKCWNVRCGMRPTNARYMFYLAQSYRDAGRPCEAMEKYRLRAQAWAAGKRNNGLRCTRLRCSPKTGEPAAEIRERYLAAYQLRPSRAEPLCELARYHRLRNEFALAHLYARQAAAIPYPGDALFVDMAVYAWRSLDELAVSAYYVGAQEDGKTALLKLLAENRFPEHERARIESNRVFYGLQSAGTATDISPPVTAPGVAAKNSSGSIMLARQNKSAGFQMLAVSKRGKLCRTMITLLAWAIVPLAAQAASSSANFVSPVDAVQQRRRRFRFGELQRWGVCRRTFSTVTSSSANFTDKPGFPACRAFAAVAPSITSVNNVTFTVSPARLRSRPLAARYRRCR